MTSFLLDFINTLLELPGGNVRGRDVCIMAALFMTLWATMSKRYLGLRCSYRPRFVALNRLGSTLKTDSRKGSSAYKCIADGIPEALT